MKLSTSLVAVKKITSTKPRSNFNDYELEQAAQLILESEGVINPIVVRRTSLQSYEVVDGDFEYYAAARAREIDPRKGEMIGVLIMEPENEKSITEQIKIFRELKPEIDNNGNMDLRTTNIESRVTNLESRFEKRTSEVQAEFRHEIQKISDRLNKIETSLPKQIEPLEALNNFSLTDLTSKLKRSNIKTQIIEAIVNERKKGRYTSFSNVVERIKGLGDKTMIKIIDNFSEGINT